jgi:hypothetical protein
MKYLLLVYNDTAMVDAMPKPEFDETMRGCLKKADTLRDEGRLLQSQMLQGASTARTIRKRGGRTMTLDGPFAETKEVLGGFNIIEADSMDEAVEIAKQFPWYETGSIEVRPVLEISTMRERVGVAGASAPKQASRPQTA